MKLYSVLNKVVDETMENLEIQNNKEIKIRNHTYTLSEKHDIAEDFARQALAMYGMFDIYKHEKTRRNLLAGGGGASPLCNWWISVSSCISSKRISGEALARLQKFGYSPEKIPLKFIRNNGKTIESRRAAGKELHEDHNPGNIKVLQLLHNKVNSYKSQNLSEDEKLKDLAEYVLRVQTLDIITIEQDDIRTKKDDTHNKKMKNFMTAEERDNLLHDTFIFKDIKIR